jgi:formylglycine-generating enzyme required for sulfatase activity/tRNA A-37 threonylcarbamoyl transferase component Bud32
MLQENQVLQGRYRIIKALGQGGMGAVFVAQELSLDITCVVKEMLPANESTFAETFAEQFKREAKTLADLRHPNLPRVTHYFIENGNYYLVMDMIEGKGLDKLIGPNGMRESVVLDIADQLLSVLEYIHSKGVLHRDIKPANIILQPDGRAVLVDFGLVKVDSSRGGKDGPSIRGLTPHYAPPEQYTGGTDQRSDLFSLAATLYQMLTGRLPVSSTDQSSGEPQQPIRMHRGDASENTERVIMKALNLDRKLRYQDAASMRAALKGSAPAQAQNPVAFMPTILIPNPELISQSPEHAMSIEAIADAGSMEQPEATMLRPGLYLDLMHVPAGEFKMGSAVQDADAFIEESPQHTLFLDLFLIGKYNVTNAQFEAFTTATGYKTTAEKEGNGYIYAESSWKDAAGADWRHPKGPGSEINGKDNYPVVLVTWDDAVAFCQWASTVTRRAITLPTEAQWEKAARGMRGRLFPWGGTFSAGGSADPEPNRVNFNMNVGAPTPVGKYSPAGDSPYGVSDMAGNVWEWTSSLHRLYPYYAKDGREDAASREARVVRGGAYSSVRRVLRCSYRSWSQPHFRFDYLGFRVVASPKTQPDPGPTPL